MRLLRPFIDLLFSTTKVRKFYLSNDLHALCDSSGQVSCEVSEGSEKGSNLSVKIGAEADNLLLRGQVTKTFV